jgi:hypothetical protein
MLETSFCCQLGAILQKDFSKMTTTPPVTERLRQNYEEKKHRILPSPSPHSMRTVDPFITEHDSLK